MDVNDAVAGCQDPTRSGVAIIRGLFREASVLRTRFRAGMLESKHEGCQSEAELPSRWVVPVDSNRPLSTYEKRQCDRQAHRSASSSQPRADTQRCHSSQFWRCLAKPSHRTGIDLETSLLPVPDGVASTTTHWLAGWLAGSVPGATTSLC